METKLWKEMLFLLIPFVAFVAFSLMAACGRVPQEGIARQTTISVHSPGDQFSDLQLSEEERHILAAEKKL